MTEPLDHLWTPESTLRLRDTSGVKLNLTQTCIYCGVLYTPTVGAVDTDPACPTCRTRFKAALKSAALTDPEGELRCLLCAKLFAAGLTVGRHDQLCPDCQQTMQGSAKLVCAKCNVTICRLQPKVLDSGFVIRPNVVLHLDACNICKPGLSESTVIEIDTWMKTQRPKKTILTPLSIKQARTNSRS